MFVLAFICVFVSMVGPDIMFVIAFAIVNVIGFVFVIVCVCGCVCVCVRLCLSYFS